MKAAKQIIPGHAGFTLVEIIASMVVVGILAVLMSSGIATIIQGYLFAQNSNATTLKGEIAMTRIIRELRSVDQVTAGSENSITYQYNKNGTQISNRTLTWSGTAGDPLRMGDNILVDGVNSFIFSFHSGYSDDTGDNVWDGDETLINVALTLNGAENINSTFEARIVPRNLYSDDDALDYDDPDDDALDYDGPDDDNPGNGHGRHHHGWDNHGGH